MPIITASIDVKEQENPGIKRAFELTIKEGDEEMILVIRSLKVLGGFLEGVKFLAGRMGMSFELTKPDVIYIPSASSGIYFCPLCTVTAKRLEELWHKHFCPNHEEGKPFTPDYEYY